MEPVWFEVVALLAGLIGLVGTLLGLVGLLARRKGVSLGWQIAGFVFVAAVAVSAGIGALTGQSIGVWGPVLLFGIAFLLFSAGRSSLAARLGTLLGSWLSAPRLQAGVLLVASPVLALWWTTALLSQQDPRPLDNRTHASTGTSGPMVEMTSVHARTDRGRAIPVHRPEDSPKGPDVKGREEELVRERVSKLLRVAPPDATHNCHGWVFAGGHYWIKNDDVDPILEDNGYQAVMSPRAGDVVVYRSPAGEAIHTGLVSSTDAGGVLIESKWGDLGRYVHSVEDQIYGPHFSFYRSARKGHLLHGLNVAPEPANTLSEPMGHSKRPG